MNVRQVMVISSHMPTLKPETFIGDGAKPVINDGIFAGPLFSIISAIFIVFLLNAEAAPA